MSIDRISQYVLGRRRLVVAFWVLVTIAGLVSTGPVSDALSTRFDLPGRESTEVNGAILEQYGSGGFANPFVAVVTLPEGTTVDSPGITDELAAAFSRVSEAAPETRIVSFVSTGDRAFVSDDGRTTFGLIYPRYAGDFTSPDETAVVAALERATVGGAPIALGGLSEEPEPEEASTGVLVETLVGAAGALIVLLWVFGSFLAVLPLVIAGVSILTSFLLVWGLTGVTDVSFLIQFLIALIGLGVAIDYSLLVVTRWREERAAGLENTAAVQRAMATAGHAVVFSGTTVAISLLALIALPVPFLRSIGIGGMLIPLVSVVVTITLLPVILASVGPKLDWPRVRSGNQVSRVWERWAQFVVRHRLLATIAGVALLAALIMPALDMQLASPASSSFSRDNAAVEALDDAGFADGVMTPFEVLVDGYDPAQVAAHLATVDGVVAAIAPQGDAWQRDGTSIVLVMPEADASGSTGRETLTNVRDAAHGLAGEVRVGGATAADADFIDAVYGNFMPMLALILGITFILLVRAFGSIVLPLKAVILNCISVGAAYGVLVLVWQKGYGSEMFWGIEATGAIPSWLPLMVFSFLFGLSMDYEVFILARMREEYGLAGSTSAAVVRGMSHTARLVTAAAVILFLAFVSMAAVPETDVKMLATGLAAGILIDATVVRGLLVPAAVALMGHWNWWLPSWLERFVPKESAAHGAAAPHLQSGSPS